MDNFSFGVITPSHTPDFERCQLLSWSIEQFVSPAVTHYIIVEARDISLFRQLQKSNTEIIAVESVLPSSMERSSLRKENWLNFTNIKIDGWILQQIIKIASAQFVNKDVLVFVDSDVVFVRPLNLQSFIYGDQVCLFREEAFYLPTHFKWQQVARSLLNLPLIDNPDPGYIGNIITWRRDNVFKLYQHLEKISGLTWLETLYHLDDFSEYILYGIFVDRILQEQSGHYYHPQKICHEYWTPLAMTDSQLTKFFAEISSTQKAIMISSKANMSVKKYQDLVKIIPQI